MAGKYQTMVAVAVAKGIAANVARDFANALRQADELQNRGFYKRDWRKIRLRARNHRHAAGHHASP